MAPVRNLFALVALGSSGVFATPTAARVGDLLDVSVGIDLLHPDPTTVPPTYPTSTPPPYCEATTVTLTETTNVPTTTTVTTTATATPSCAPALTCDKYGYLIQNVTLYRVDLATGRYSTVADHLGDDSPINAMAYHPFDNYLYARQARTNALIRIGSDGQTTNVATFPADSTPPNIGDIDNEGYYWYSSAGTTWEQMDLRPGSATYGKRLARGTADPLGLSVADWAYLPSGGAFMYSLGRDSAGGNTLIRFSLSNKKWTVIQQYPKITGTFGAVYGYNNGTLYASNNGNGRIYAFPIKGGAATLASQGPISGSNDGARCAFNLAI